MSHAVRQCQNGIAPLDPARCRTGLLAADVLLRQTAIVRRTQKRQRVLLGPSAGSLTKPKAAVGWIAYG